MWWDEIATPKLDRPVEAGNVASLMKAGSFLVKNSDYMAKIKELIATSYVSRSLYDEKTNAATYTIVNSNPFHTFSVIAVENGVGVYRAELYNLDLGLTHEEYREVFGWMENRYNAQPPLTTVLQKGGSPHAA